MDNATIINKVNSKGSNNNNDDDDGYNAFLDVLSTLPIRKLEDKAATTSHVDAGIVPMESTAEPNKQQSFSPNDNPQRKDDDGPSSCSCSALFSFGPLAKFYLIYLGIPSVLVAWYAAAILFPPEYRSEYPALLWTDGALTYEESDDDNGTMTIIPTVCPRETICSEGIFQIVLIAIARLTAFVSYIFMAVTFWSKMHNVSHILSTSYFSTTLPLPDFHEVHKFSGLGYAVLAMLHAVGHFIRWMIRSEMVRVSLKIMSRV